MGCPYRTDQTGGRKLFDKIRDMLKNPEQLLPVSRAQAHPAPRPQPPQPERNVRPPVIEPFTGTTTETAAPQVRQPDMFRGNIDHSGHLRLLARNDAEAAKLSIDALTDSRQRLTMQYGPAEEVSGYMTGESMLDVLTLARNGDTMAAYPVFKAGSPWPARVTRTTECENGLEGQIEVFTDGTVQSFFDAMYFRNKGAYAPGRDVRVLLAGIAYVMARGRGAVEDSMIVHFEGGDLDDYVFRGIALDVHEFMAMGRRAWAIKTSLRFGHDSPLRDFYICATPGALQEKISPGDRISGIIWLQGFVLP
jgi:hypothetical protein